LKLYVKQMVQSLYQPYLFLYRVLLFPPDSPRLITGREVMQSEFWLRINSISAKYG
jgi:hypothetical protein